MRSTGEVHLIHHHLRDRPLMPLRRPSPRSMMTHIHPTTASSRRWQPEKSFSWFSHCRLTGKYPCREIVLYRAIDTLGICRSGDCEASKLPVKGSNGIRVCAVEMTSRV